MWLAKEVTSCIPTTLTALLYSPINRSFSPYTKNYIVKTSLRIWRQFRRYYGLQTFSMSAPIASNFAFSPSMMDNTFSQWATYGLSMFKDLYIDDVFASFQQLVDKFSLPRNNFFRYLQARSFIRNMYPQFPRLPTPTSIDLFLEPLPFGKRMISFFYDKICSLHRSSLLSIKTQWEEDLLEEISDELWESILYRVHSSSVCVKHGWIQCKILHHPLE